MTDVKEIAKRAHTAWETKDEATMRTLVHDDYCFKGPMQEFKGPDAYIDCMMNFPFEGRNENVQIIAEGNKVVYASDWIVTAPFSQTIPMVMVMEFKDGKLKNENLFFDTALFPAAMAA